MEHTGFRILFSFLLVSIYPSNAYSQWSSDPQINTPVCTAAGNQISPQAVTDGHHGAIVAWLDFRNGNADIYAQRLNIAGIPQWTDNGIAVCASAGCQVDLEMISDGSGGAIVAWRNTGNGGDTIFCQKIDAAGALQWTGAGVVICASPGAIGRPDLIGDAKGGAIITWSDDRSGNFDIYAQHIDASGIVQWPADGVTICNAEGAQTTPQLAGTGMGGAVVTWADERKISNSDIYAQAIDASGAALWSPENGRLVCKDISYRTSPRIIEDGVNGGSIIGWVDLHSRPGIHAQRLDSNGSAVWTTNGVEVCDASDTQFRIVGDGSGGAIIAWGEYYFPNRHILCRQRIDKGGTVKWPEKSVGVAVIGVFLYYKYEMISLGQRWLLLTYFSKGEISSGGAVSAVRLDTVGTWSNKIQMSSSKYNKIVDNEIPTQFPVCDGAGGAIVTWYERGVEGKYDIYAQNINAFNQLGRIPTIVGESDIPNDRGGRVPKDAGLPREFALEQNYPNPFNPSTTVRYALPSSAHVRLEVYNTVGVRVAILVDEDEEAGLKTVAFNATGQPSGVYFCRLEAGTFTATKKLVVLR